MTPRYLLDTNAISDIVRHPRGPVARRRAVVGPSRVFTSAIAAAELRYGATKRGSERLSRGVDEVLSRLEIAALERPVDVAYGELRTALERSGALIGPNDLFIAAHALALGAVLVTDNEGEFRRVPGLAVENWLRA